VPRTARTLFSHSVPRPGRTYTLLFLPSKSISILLVMVSYLSASSLVSAQVSFR
jgi:hypothetical protein